MFRKNASNLQATLWLVIYLSRDLSLRVKLTLVYLSAISKLQAPLKFLVQWGASTIDLKWLDRKLSWLDHHTIPLMLDVRV